MNRLLFIFSLFSFKLLFSQENKSIEIIKELNISYTDTIYNNVYFGNYEPTGIIKTNDSSYLISTILSIFFPHDTTYRSSDFNKYVELLNLQNSKEHISSGSILKLNKNLEKQWEIILKDRRVTHIENFDSNSFIIAGERVDQKKIWVAQLRTADGSILWLKEYKIGHKHSTYDLCIQNNIIYVLGEMRRLVPISIEKNYKKRRIVFFQKLSLRSLVLL